MDNDKPTLKDRYNGLNTMQKVGLGGVAVAVLGTLGYVLFGRSEAQAATKNVEPSTTKTEPTTPTGSNQTTPSTPADDEIEAIYSTPNALALKLDALPLLRPQFGSEPGSSFFVIGADSNPETSDLIATYTNDTLKQNGVMTGNAPDRTPVSMPGGRFISDFAATTALRGAVSPPADLMIIVLGRQDQVPVGALKESLARMRAAMPAQRILWVLSADAPPSIAKALNESKEEWINAGLNTSMAAWKAATVNQAGDLATTFPAVPAVPAGQNQGYTPFGI